MLYIRGFLYSQIPQAGTLYVYKWHDLLTDTSEMKMVKGGNRRGRIQLKRISLVVGRLLEDYHGLPACRSSFYQAHFYSKRDREDNPARPQPSRTSSFF